MGAVETNCRENGDIQHNLIHYGVHTVDVGAFIREKSILKSSVPVLKSAAKVFTVTFAVAFALLILLFVYLIVTIGWTEAFVYAMQERKGWLRALILMPTVCVAAELLGTVIERLWRSKK